ncbi:MAG: hypothetical protein ACTHMG_07980 [Sphingomonas sp.]
MEQVGQHHVTSSAQPIMLPRGVGLLIAAICSLLCWGAIFAAIRFLV